MATRVAPRAGALIAVVLAHALSGCDVENAGDVPPLAGLYFPNALALSTDENGDSRFLFVTSSNFDLRYNSGSLHAFSLDALDERIDACAMRGTLGADKCQIPASEMLADEVTIPTFSTSLAVSPDGKRIFIATRTRGALTVVDVDPDADDAALDGDDPIASSLLGCGNPAGRSCATVTGDGSDATTGATLRFPEDPSDILTGPLSDLTGEDPGDGAQYVAVAHQRGDISLFVDEGEPEGVPALTSVLSGLAPTPTGIARDPRTGVLYVSRLGNGLLRIGVAIAEDESAPHDVRLSLFDAGQLPIEGATLSDVRAIGFAPPSTTPEVDADDDRALVVSNLPSALALTRLTPGSTGNGRVERLTEIGSGGSRLTVGRIGGRPIAAVSCLGSREIYVIDLDSMNVRAVVPNLSGPHGIALDEARERLYVTDFRSSVVRIVDLSPLARPEGDADADAESETVRIVATLGTPRVVQELQ